jgi:hypothetical protein
MSETPNSTSELLPIDTRNASGTIVMPQASAIPGRVLTFKDAYGSFSVSSVYLSTQYGDSFDNGTTSLLLQDTYGYATFVADGVSKWYLTDGTIFPMYTISTLQVSSRLNTASLYTNQIPTFSTINLQDTSVTYPLFAQSSFLYYGSNIVAGVKTGSAQILSVV